MFYTDALLIILLHLTSGAFADRILTIKNRGACMLQAERKFTLRPFT